MDNDAANKFERTRLTDVIVKALTRAKTLTKDGSNKIHLAEYLEFQRLLDMIEKDELDVRFHSRVL